MGAFITQKLQQSTDESGSYESCYSIPWSEHSFIFYCEVHLHIQNEQMHFL